MNFLNEYEYFKKLIPSRRLGLPRVHPKIIEYMF